MPGGVTGRGNAWTGVFLSISVLAITTACERANPAFRGSRDASTFPDGQGDAADDLGIDVPRADAPIDRPRDTGTDVPRDVGNDLAVDRAGDVRPDVPPDIRPDVAQDVSPDIVPDVSPDLRSDVPPDVVAPDAGFTCAVAADCTTRFGAPVCGTWECLIGVCSVNCPNCTDVDRDGYGVGTGCAGADCDDTNAAIRGFGQRSCYSDPSTRGKGACRDGVETCTAGLWGACTGQVTPTGEACNGEDDDCDGVVDNGLPTFTCGAGACQNSVASCSGGLLATCVAHTTNVAVDSTCDGIDDDCDGQIDEDCVDVIATCVHVSPTGVDNGADGTAAAPFQTIQAAIAFAATRSKMVCVAGGPTCSDRTIYTLAASTGIVMANGVSVYGNYQSTSWARCPLSPTAPDPTVTIALGSVLGVSFTSAINTPTTLDGFVLARTTGPTIAAVTVNGARQVRLSNLVVNDAPTAVRSYGVNLLGGGEALITHCSIQGGAGTIESIGVRSVASSPTLRENCSALDPTTGRCVAACASAPGLAIRGRVTTPSLGTSTAVHLDTSPNASVETSTLCAGQGMQAIGVRVLGDAAGAVVRGNTISAAGGVTDSLGVWAQDCNDETPWFVGNQIIEGQGASRAIGLLGVGACHPVVDGNAFITGGGDGTTTEADGVCCQTNDAGEASQCAVLGNEMIQGSSNNRSTLSAGVACKEGGCVRVAGNIVQGSQGGDVIGVWLRVTGTMVERNRITGGCGAQTASGILADDTFARLQNNLVSGGTCASGGPSPLSIGLRVYSAAGPNELEIHSNTIDAGGSGSCVGVGIEYGVGPDVAPSGPKGTVRNNILRGGACSSRSDFAEVRTASDPRFFQNNDLDPTSPSVLYSNENATALQTADAVNALTDITSKANIAANPAFVAFPNDLHLGTGSACSKAGTPAGAPLVDFDGKARDPSRPSIGAYE